MNPTIRRVAQAILPRFVVLQTMRGLIEERVTLDASGTAVAHLQSAGIETAVIRASDPPFHDGMESVGFTWPIAFALFTILGGIAGAALRKGVKRHKTRKYFDCCAGSGCRRCRHTVGIDYGIWGTPADRAGERMFFVIAAIAGFLGRQVMELLVKGAKGG
jgi:hypothetical protein